MAVWFDEPALPIDDGVHAVLDRAVAALRDAWVPVGEGARQGFETGRALAL